MAQPEMSDDGMGRATLAAEAFALLRRDLMANRFRPGERLRFDRMRELYAIGAAPLREALSRLAATGLVVQIGQKGFRAASASLDDLRDVVQTRRFLECRAAQEAVAHGDQAWEAALVASFERFGAVSRAKPRTQAARAEWEARHTHFHRTLVSGCPSRWLREVWSIVFDQAERYRRLAIAGGCWSPDEYGDHERLLNAVLARQSERIGELLGRHIGVSADRLVARLGPELEAVSGASWASQDAGQPLETADRDGLA